MFPEIGIVQHVYDIVRSIGILFSQLIQNVEFHHSLIQKTFFVAYDFDGHMCVGFVIQSTNHLAKTALANDLQDFIAKSNVIMLQLTKKYI